MSFNTSDNTMILIWAKNVLNIFLMFDGMFFPNVWSRIYEIIVEYITHLDRIIYHPIVVK